jgi:hypothetical protein
VSSPWPAAVQDVLDRADETLVHGGVLAVSVSTGRVRGWLRFRGWTFLEPGPGEPPPLGELDHTAARVIERSAALAAALGGTAALGGAALVPSEAALSGVLVLRMVQRLCVVYGFELETDRGQDAVTRALAAVWSVALPPGGVRHLRVSDLPRILRGRAGPTEVGASLVTAMTRGTLGWAASRVSRLLPVVSAPRHADDARRAVLEAGRRASGVLRRLAEVTDATELPLEEAFVVR